jgi:LysR family transcriptional regulator, chromosome initiation inhibitor
MLFDPRQLAAFDATVQTGSLSAAAVTLRITLAATSLRIKALEESLGQRLLVRGKVARATPAGQALLTHIKQVRLLEADLAHTLHPARSAAAGAYQSISVAVNADSLASWFFPGVQAALQKHQLTLDVTVDDQNHTLEWLKNGDVIGCVTTLPTALRGCVAEPLGTMRYRCVAAPSLRDKLLAKNRSKPAAQPAIASAAAASPTTGKYAMGLHQLVTQPAIGFNRKDGLQDAFLQRCFGMADLAYPRHYIPAVDAYHDALLSGVGWGMQADIQSPGDLESGALVDLFPGQWVDVPLFWHHWQREAPQAARLTLAIKAAAGKLLTP